MSPHPIPSANGARPLSAPRETILEAQILSLACGNQSTAIDLIRLLAETNQSLLGSMQKALHEARWTALASEAHRLLGAARLIGWRTLCRMTTRVEAAAKAGDREAARTALLMLESVIARLDASLARLLDTHKKSPT
ncbi:Hpt domain-containing protein [Paraburkholderia phosphatilytica]|uniref:Hpt domain-containing protein n=1 Tax=Paraburkholderia phosphatilytica TaxID=2282883 RepID=UPI000E4D448D|nr:Hpt domain-containing protein [Paraburkholderia phosphatilytica]